MGICSRAVRLQIPITCQKTGTDLAADDVVGARTRRALRSSSTDCRRRSSRESSLRPRRRARAPGRRRRTPNRGTAEWVESVDVQRIHVQHECCGARDLPDPHFGRPSRLTVVGLVPAEHRIVARGIAMPTAEPLHRAEPDHRRGAQVGRERHGAGHDRQRTRRIVEVPESDTGRTTLERTGTEQRVVTEKTRSPSLPQPVPTPSGRSGIRPFAFDFTSNRVVPGDPAPRNSASATIRLRSRTVPSVARRSVCATHRPSASSSMSLTRCRISTWTFPGGLGVGEPGHVDGELAAVVHPVDEVAVGVRRGQFPGQFAAREVPVDGHRNPERIEPIGGGAIEKLPRRPIFLVVQHDRPGW